jgi:alkylation response protein AidB-like acyl-CoA dehydrogenase
MNNLQLTEDQHLIVDTVRKFVADSVTPRVQEDDEHRRAARAQFDGLAELGMFGLVVAEANGGAGMGFVPYAAALECIGTQSSSLARLWIAQTQCTLACEAAGGQLDALLDGSVPATFVGPEHGLRWGGGELAGVADLVPGAMIAGRFVAAATENGAPVLLAVDAAVGKRDELASLGLASAGCAKVSWDAAAAEVLATGDAAARAIDRAQMAAWIGVAAAAVGGGLGAVEAARSHASERIAFGKPLLAQQAVQQKLVECRRQIEAARHLLWHAARVADAGGDAFESALHARVTAVEAMLHAADEAIQVHGGFGYTVEYHVERHYRDAKTLEVLDCGSGQLRSLLAARWFA